MREACKAIEKEFGAKGLGISYPYSPGYCGWKVSDQQILFSLLPNQPCGVSLTASSLMCPIKSVSGVVGIGRQMTRQKYGCELCGKKDCYKNRLNK
ncbi:vitamin B12 dependent-methionine synthase activation domain-containing protein [Bacteroides fragilis]